MSDQQIGNPATGLRPQFLEWLQNDSDGLRLRDCETSYLLDILKLTYYQRILQVGSLGTEYLYIPDNLSRNFMLLDDALSNASSAQFGQIAGSVSQWPIATESLDLVILPHLLEFESDPHAVLCEAERTLKGNGKLYILGFNPWSLRTLLPFSHKPPAACNGYVGFTELLDWLNLLKFEAQFNAGLGLSSRKPFIKPDSAWQSPWAYLNLAYAVVAVKRTWTPILLKESWLSKAELVPGQAMAPPVMKEQKPIHD